MKIDLKAGTVNDMPYRIDENLLRWSARNAAPAGAPAAPERRLEIESPHYTGPVLGKGVGTYECAANKENPGGLLFAP